MACSAPGWRSGPRALRFMLQRGSRESVAREGRCVSSWCLSWHTISPRTAHTNDQLLRLYHEEEHEAAEEKAGPDPEWEAFCLEKSLEGPCVSKQELYYDYDSDAQWQVLIAEMGLQRK